MAAALVAVASLRLEVLVVRGDAVLRRVVAAEHDVEFRVVEQLGLGVCARIEPAVDVRAAVEGGRRVRCRRAAVSSRSSSRRLGLDIRAHIDLRTIEELPATSEPSHRRIVAAENKRAHVVATHERARVEAIGAALADAAL